MTSPNQVSNLQKNQVTLVCVKMLVLTKRQGSVAIKDILASDADQFKLDLLAKLHSIVAVLYNKYVTFI